MRLQEETPGSVLLFGSRPQTGDCLLFYDGTAALSGRVAYHLGEGRAVLFSETGYRKRNAVCSPILAGACIQKADIAALCIGTGAGLFCRTA